MAAPLECCTAAPAVNSHAAFRDSLQDLRDYLQGQFDNQNELLRELGDRSKNFDGELAALRHFLARSRNPKTRPKAGLDARGVGIQGVGEVPRYPVAKPPGSQGSC